MSAPPSPQLPPDRGHVTTEQPHTASASLDLLDTDQLIDMMAAEAHEAANAVHEMTPALSSFIDALVVRLKRGGRLLYLGAGTSGRLGVLDASECPPTFQSDPSQIIGLIAGGDAALRRSSEHREDELDDAIPQLDDLGVGPDDVVLGISAGGTTPWPLGGLNHARSRGCLTALLCCAEPEEHGVDHLLCLKTGAELLTGSTRMKAGTATKIALNAITTIAFTKLGKVHGNRMVDIRATNKKLHDRAIRILMTYDESLDRTEADALLQQCDGELKTAIVSQCRKLSPQESRTAITEVDGHLARLLDI